MKRFLSAVCLCACLLISGLFLLSPASEAQNNILQSLLDLPAPPPPNPFFQGSKGERSGKFYSKNNPPGDDAPIEDLLDYWKMQSRTYTQLGYNIKPSEKSTERILAEIDKNPASLPEFLKALPETSEVADFVKRIYDENSAKEDFEESWSEAVGSWLLYNSKYFSDDLLKIAAQAGDSGEYVSNQEALLALARVDWEKARPLLERLYNDRNQPVSQVLARWGFYLHALDTDSFGDTEKYRDELKAIVEDKNATDGMRDLAFDALVKEKDWQGRDEWYMTLLEDETLDDLRVNGRSYTGLTTIIYYSPPEKYADKMIELLKSDNQAVRNAAVRNLGKLLDENNPEVIKALLPWLENPKWAKEVSGERRQLVDVLEKLKIPESVPGLIAVLNEKETREVVNLSRNSNVSVNSSNVASNSYVSTRQVDSYPYRGSAIEALATQKDSRAASALRAILPQVEEYERQKLVRAILLSNGFSVPEQIDALETTAKNANETYESSNTNMMPAVLGNTTTRREVTSFGEGVVASGNYSVTPRPYNPADIKPILGYLIVNNLEPSNELVMGLIDRIAVLDAKDAQLAADLRRIIRNWRGAAVNSLMLRDLKNGKAELDSVVRLLGVRKELKEKQSGEVFDARGGGNRFASGITACLLDDEYDAILAGENIESKIAMLGCARLIRAKLPIQKVSENLKSPNKMLALAAERYLESEDSPEARQILLSLYPNEAKILGAKTYFAPGDESVTGDQYLAEIFVSVNNAFFPGNLDLPFDSFSEDYKYIENVETNLKKEVMENALLLGVYAYDRNFIRIYKDKAVFSWEENAARYRERDLSVEEFDGFKNYLASQRVDELPPFLSYGEEYLEKELLMLGRQGGRRVYMKSDKMPPFFAGLEGFFEEMRKPSAKLRYYLEKDIPGLEILFADEQLQARTVWKNGSDFRVLIEDPERRKRIDKELALDDTTESDEQKFGYDKIEEMSRKRREAREYEHFSWHKLEKNKLSDLADQPSQVEYLPFRDIFAAQATNERWKARTANVEIRADSQGLYKISGGTFTKIQSGHYDKPVVSANGRWVIAVKFGEEVQNLVRVNLLTNKESIINFEDYPLIEASAFIPSINKFLLFSYSYQDYEEETERSGSYYLLDAETGIMQEVKGEIRPLAQQTFRPLQTAANANEFWAAIPDSEKNETEIGIYNNKTLSFKILLKIPRIKFDSMNMWVDAGKVYFAFDGQLLSLPLPKE